MSAEGFSSAHADNILNAWGNATAYTGSATLFVQLHTAHPGAAGTTAIAGNSTRQSLSWGTSSGGSMTNDVALTWTNVSTSETYAYFTIWTLSSGGTFYGSGSVTANAVTAGDTFTVAIAGATASLTIAA